MAQKTRLNSKEVANLLMDSPVTVCEWMQNGMLHAEVSGVIKRPFTMEDVAQFTKQNGKQFNRPGQGKLRILIVNNDLRSAHRRVELLDTLSETADTVTVHNTFDAGRKLSKFRPDILLMEAGVPRQECLEICREIKSGHETHHVKIVAVLEASDHYHKQRMFMAGADSCLDYPVNNQEMFNVMGLSLDPSLDREGAYQEG